MYEVSETIPELKGHHDAYFECGPRGKILVYILRAPNSAVVEAIARALRRALAFR